MTEKRDIFAELMEGMDALAADKAEEKQAPVFTPFTDADAERLAGLLNGSEK